MSSTGALIKQYRTVRLFLDRLSCTLRYGIGDSLHEIEGDAHVRKSDSKRQTILDTALRLFRTQGFDKTSVSEITAEVGGSKATIYSHFPSKEELFVECMMAAAENYMAETLKHLDASNADPDVALFDFGRSFLNFICSPEQLEVRRLMIAEAARSSTRPPPCGHTFRHSCPHAWHLEHSAVTTPLLPPIISAHCSRPRSSNPCSCMCEKVHQLRRR